MALRTVPVYLTSGKRRFKVNALLDYGSSRTYVNSDIAPELGLEGSPHELTVNVLNDNQEKFETMEEAFAINSLDGKVSKRVSAYTTERVTGHMDVVDWKRFRTRWKHLQDIEFPHVSPRTTVDLLIGVDQAEQLLYSLKDVKGPPREPIGRLTPLRWTCIGNPDRKTERTHANFNFFLNESDKLNSRVRRYWDIEEPTCTKSLQHCLNDPLGPFTPYTVQAKILLQEMWASGVHWDESVSETLSLQATQRFNELAAFSQTSVDFGGPFITKQGREKTHQKRYLSLFTCLATRAVHLEIAFSLGTDSFLNAFFRMTSQRGLPEDIVSDNGTNFDGGSNELKELEALHKKKIRDATTSAGVN